MHKTAAAAIAATAAAAVAAVPAAAAAACAGGLNEGCRVSEGETGESLLSPRSQQRKDGDRCLPATRATCGDTRGPKRRHLGWKGQKGA